MLDLGFVESVQWVCDTLSIPCENTALNDSKMAQRAKIQRMKELVKLKKKSKVNYEPVSQIVMNDIEDYIHPYILQQGFKESTLKEAVRFLITTL